MSASKPEVTVVIPTRDRWPLLLRAVSIVLAQRDVAVRVVVVDDGSRTAPSRAPALRDPRILVLRQPRTRGPGAARNRGLAHVRSPWVAFLDDDDLWAPDKLARQLSAAEAAGASLAFCSAYEVGGALEMRAFIPAPQPRALVRELTLANMIPAGSSNVLVRMRSLQRVGLFDEGLLHLTDWDMWLRLADQVCAAALPDALLAYVLHGTNFAASAPNGVLAEYSRLRRKHGELARRHSSPFHHERFLAWCAERRRLGGAARAAGLAQIEGGLRFRDARAVLRGGAEVAAPSLMASRRPPLPPPPESPEWLTTIRRDAGIAERA